jgi:hypothetical protein
MQEESTPADVDSLIREAVERLPEEIRRDGLELILHARQASAAELERDLIAASRSGIERFRAAAAAVERKIGG